MSAIFTECFMISRCQNHPMWAGLDLRNIMFMSYFESPYLLNTSARIFFCTSEEGLLLIHKVYSGDDMNVLIAVLAKAVPSAN